MSTSPTQFQTVALPTRLPLVAPIQARDATVNKDAQLVNCYAELDQVTQEYVVEKRPGLLKQATVGQPTTNLGLGMYTWSGTKRVLGVPTPFVDVYSIFGQPATFTYLYKNGVNFGTLSPGTSYQWVQIRGAGVNPGFLVFGNGNLAYYTDGTTFNNITDVNFPGRYVKGFAYLDGTMYVMDETGNIFGSKNLDDPTVWDPLNVIVARNEPDRGIALAKQLVYVIALTQWTSQAFYDAGNATGSPLTVVPGAQTVYGCISADTVQQIDGILLWVSANRSAALQIVKMDNLTVTVISTPAVDRLIANAGNSTFYSWTFKDFGHRFYGITSKGNNVTLVYDLDQNLWYRWSDANGNYWPIVAQAYDSSLNHLAQHETNGNIYYQAADYTYPNDDGIVVPVDIYTPNFDAGVDRRKNLPLMRFNADQRPGSTLQVRYSDDDYQHWSNFRSVNLGNKRPILTNMGTFYRRAHHFRHFANTPLRIRSVDLTMDIGTL